MGSFADALFSVLLGWLRGAAAWLWQLVSGDGSTSAWIGWILDNWLPLTVLLCIVGLLVDLAVYFFRWQPYRVWKRFLHLGGDPENAEEAEGADEAPVKHRWIYADGSSVPVREDQAPANGPLPYAGNMPRPRREAELDAPLRPVKRVQPAKMRRTGNGSGEYQMPDLTDGRDTYHQPYYPPQWTAKQDQRGGDR